MVLLASTIVISASALYAAGRVIAKATSHTDEAERRASSECLTRREFLFPFAEK